MVRFERGGEFARVERGRVLRSFDEAVGPCSRDDLRGAVVDACPNTEAVRRFWRRLSWEQGSSNRDEAP